MSAAPFPVRLNRRDKPDKTTKKMEFKSLKNIETSFRQIRLFTLVFLGLCAVVAVFSVVKSYQFAQRQREKIYVLDQGKSLMLALSQDLSQNRPVEARELPRALLHAGARPGGHREQHQPRPVPVRQERLPLLAGSSGEGLL